MKILYKIKLLEKDFKDFLKKYMDIPISSMQTFSRDY